MAIGTGFEPVMYSNRYKTALVNGWRSFSRYMYNTETREVMERDGISWMKISIFYAAYYTGLATLFVAFLAVFFAQMDRQAPTYYGERSLMASRARLNPGIGFRPQPDPEDSTIFYRADVSDDQFQRILSSLRQYLDAYFDQRWSNKTEKCETKSELEIEELKKEGKICDFVYNEVLNGTSCDPKNHFGYLEGPCVALKLNKIYSWKPEAYQNASDLPEASERRSESYFVSLNSDEGLLKSNVLVDCEGEFSADRDYLAGADIVYYSGSKSVKRIGLFPFYFYPYTNQESYKQPLVFVHFKRIPENVLINIVCRAYAANIDASDKMNLRGMTKIQIFIKK